MKDQILAKIQLLRQVTEESYIIHDGTNYRSICVEINKMINEAALLQKITSEDYKEISEELDDVVKYVTEVRNRAIKKYESKSQLN